MFSMSRSDDIYCLSVDNLTTDNYQGGNDVTERWASDTGGGGGGGGDSTKSDTFNERDIQYNGTCRIYVRTLL